jgi:3-phenylpropionate/trans-cinnamate dioxygenase ferredoxin reductase subunit
MAPDIVPGRHLLVVGGGYIGLEAAAVARKSGMQVTLIEAAPRILGRVAAAETADAMRALHAAHGVDIREGTGLSRLTGDTRVTGAVLADGTELAADAVVVGIGVTPDTRLAEAAGLSLENGIAVDALGRTTDPAILAAGDCASFPAPDGRRMRLESVGNAIDMGEMVADTLLGQPTAYIPKPWFWSDQYDAKLQIAGLGTGADRIVARKGEAGAWSHWYYTGPRLIAVDALNDSRAYMVGKRLIEADRSPDPAAISDPATDLKALLKAA